MTIYWNKNENKLDKTNLILCNTYTKRINIKNFGNVNKICYLPDISNISMLLKSVGDLSQRPCEIVNIPSLSVKKKISSILIYDNIRLMNKINSKYMNKNIH